MTSRLLAWLFISMKALRDLVRLKNSVKKIRRHGIHPAHQHSEQAAVLDPAPITEDH